ncbi:hypothetical protein ABL78_3064 [Leptomonas seymouri]|uniref:Right handed beta helix domain-containing protein n=1 Tax=Leptomonas seymouri TaxID=5684 RepID=A0A0N0P723_LEPSE|nr:hypothetical protein ABL78_3064 [Leptomonas seymouri]|eukprot:KPI87837.1 hypothetical protein ABL78_3064 [Leptomonas seymouri]
MDVRAELVHLYTTYNPKRLKDVDALLERFKGREHVILKSLREKYAKSSGAAAARRANESLLTNPSLLLANASSVMGDTNEASGVASVGSAAGGFESLPPPSHRVPALKPVTPSAPLAHLLSSSSLASSRVLPQGHHDSSTAAVEVPGGAAATTHRPPPPPSAPLPTSPFLFRNGAAASSTCTSAARLAEMQELIRQMTLLDVRQLAVRVGELTRPPANGEGRVPQLQWRQGHSGNRSSLTAPAGEARGDVSEVLQHTSVFVDFFATCARRYVALAQEEQAYLETQRQRALPRGRAATSAGGNAAALHEGEGSGGSAPKEDSSPPLHPLPTHNTVARSFAEGGSNHNSVAHTPDYQRNGHHQTNTSPLPPPKDDERTSAAAAAARERSGASPPSPSVRCDRKAAASCVRNMRHVCSASPLSTNDVGSPPACRTTTVSPLTSPDDISASPERRRRQSDEGELFASSEPPRRSRGLSHTPPSPPPPLPVSPPPPAPSGKTLREPTLRRDHIHMSSSSMRSEGLSTPPPPSPPSQPAPDALGQLTMTRAACHKAKRVLHWAPVDNQGNRYGPLCATLEAGDCVVLQPGVYYENLHLEHRGRVEFTSAYPGAAVVLQPFSDLEPVLSVSGARTQVELTGVVLVQGGVDNNNEEEKRRDNSHRLSAGVGHGGRGEGHGRVALDKPSVPLLLVRDGAGVSATACHFYGGTGGGVVAAGQHTRLRLDLCLISLCSFAGVYIHGGASASILQSKMKRSEVGLRVLQGSFSVSETSFEGNRSDGIVLYEESMGVLERSNVLNNGGNGIFLSRGTELRVVASVIELNAFYGVQRARGSTLHVKSSFVRDNGLLPINEELA